MLVSADQVLDFSAIAKCRTAMLWICKAEEAGGLTANNQYCLVHRRKEDNWAGNGSHIRNWTSNFSNWIWTSVYVAHDQYKV